MGWEQVLSLLGGIGGWGIAVCYSTYLWLCGRGTWGCRLGWFVASWTLGVGRADDGVTRTQVGSFFQLGFCALGCSLGRHRGFACL